MSTSTVTSKEKVEDLVKKALKEELEKRKVKVAVSSTDTCDEKFTFVSESKEIDVASLVSRLTLDKGQQYFSDLFKEIRVDPDEDFAVTCFKDMAWDERIASFVPSINPIYVIDKDLAKTILTAWELNEKVLCYGPTGAGKSSLIEQLCAYTGRPFVRINCTGDMDSSMIFGQLTAKDGSTVWVDGAVTDAVKYGAVFAWDEWDVTPPEISMGLQWLLEELFPSKYMALAINGNG